MLTIEGVAKSLGLSTRAVHRRVDALGGRLDGHLRRGQNNELLFNSEALAILKRLETLRKTEGIPIRQAAVRIRDELGGNGIEPLREGAGGRARDELVEALKAEIARLQEENLWLRARVEELTPLALPRPHRTWLSWLRPLRGR